MNIRRTDSQFELCCCPAAEKIVQCQLDVILNAYELWLVTVDTDQYQN